MLFDKEKVNKSFKISTIIRQFIFFGFIFGNRRSVPLSSNIIEIIGSFAPLTLESPII